MLDTTPPPTLRDVAERAGVSVSTVNRVLADSTSAGAGSRRRVRDAIAELGYVEPAARPAHATIADVAARAGVSITTVSRVLTESGQVNDRTQRKVLAAMADLDYVANGHARALNLPGRGQVAVISASMLGPAFVGIAEGIESVVSVHGHQFVVHTAGDDGASESAHVETLRGQRAQAVVFLGGVVDDDAYRERIAGYARSLGSVGTRLVLCARPAVPGLADVASVDYDNADGTRRLTEHLLGLGHTEIAFVGGRAEQSTRLARWRGYHDAMVAAGLPDRDVPTPDWEIEDGVRGVIELWAERPVTAIVAARDLVAVGAIRELRQRGLAVPDQVSVVGFDDLPLTGDLSPSLTTARTPMREIGQAVATFAIGRATLDVDLHQRLPVELVLRESTAAPPDLVVTATR